MYYHKYKKMMDETIKSDDEHRQYLYQQLERTMSKKKESFNGESNILKQTYLINQLKEKVELTNLKILYVGCRSIEEINYFKSVGAKEVIGIDLFFEDNDILLMDMHDMTFEDNVFDLIFSSHSLEHARDYKKAISEFVRVAKDGTIFVIEVPINYETRGADLWDFKSLENLK